MHYYLLRNSRNRRTVRGPRQGLIEPYVTTPDGQTVVIAEDRPWASWAGQEFMGGVVTPYAGTPPLDECKIIYRDGYNPRSEPLRA